MKVSILELCIPAFGLLHPEQWVELSMARILRSSLSDFPCPTHSILSILEQSRLSSR
jgi:hypothetical protein